MGNVSEFVKARIVRQPERGSVPNEKLIEVYHDIFPDIELARRRNAVNQMIFLRADDYGRSVYFTTGWEWGYIDGDPTRIHLRVATLFQPDHSFAREAGVLLITDPLNYQTALRLFMEANGWDTPFNP